MPRRSIRVNIFPAYKKDVPAQWLRRVGAEALAVADPEDHASASLVVADDETLRDLNLRFRGLDEVTDVLSFGQSGGQAGLSDTKRDSPFPAVPEEEGMMGEVVVSYPQAVRQAAEHHWPVEQELALLVVHGVLHLFGHDHAEPEEEALMKGLEERALAWLSPAGATGPRR
jgi:probable rRNA maturation factor